ncbi:hypothetical protein DNU06_03950 [Putridiphycobacter roseus]|uniref:Major facilitator superfamily (MFS) profile domain-containing protein n=1 Tax=Putridiphycobacter roseus TaxID=2219161 RepID=A0A2W1N2M7_9FLAO|nr:MFS transporter [Putridiphycobacter roseus]PZE17780.1 hypothetical protein DNU06_03950 [Putridiphycobacter roseus]
MNSNKNIYIITGILFLITAAVNLEMPLFKQYADNENFGVGMVGFAFASYIGGLVPSALLLGGLSDRIGKKKVLLIALLLSTTSVLIMIIYPHIYALFYARILVGSAVALSISTGSSYLSEMFVTNKETNASLLVVIATSFGFGGGALFTSIVLVYVSTLIPITYWIVLSLSILWLFLTLTLPETETDRTKKIIQLPLFPKGAFQYNFSIALFWAATGVVISIIPSQIAKFNLGAWSGLSLFLINGSGAMFLPIAKRIPIKQSMTIAYILLPTGLTLLTIGSIYGFLSLILIGCSIIGVVCYGFGYYGTLAGVSNLNPTEKPRVVSGYIMIGYLGFGIPGVIMGVAADKYGIEISLIVYLILTSILIAFLMRYQAKKNQPIALV